MNGSSETSLPRGLVIAQGYLDLATGPAAKLGLAVPLQRQTLRTALRTAFECQVSRRHRPQRALLIGQALRLLERYDLAIVPLRRAAQAAATRRDALLGLAWCCKRLGDLEAAILAITRAAARDPGDADLHYNLACYLALSFESKAALRELAWAFELKPSLRFRAVDEADFDSLRGVAAFEALLAAGSRGYRRSGKLPAWRPPSS